MLLLLLYVNGQAFPLSLSLTHNECTSFPTVFQVSRCCVFDSTTTTTTNAAAAVVLAPHSIGRRTKPSTEFGKFRCPLFPLSASCLVVLHTSLSPRCAKVLTTENAAAFLFNVQIGNQVPHPHRFPSAAGESCERVVKY